MNSQLRLYDGPELGEQFESALILPVNFNLLAIDQQKVSSFKQGFRNQELYIRLPAGPHTLTLEYEDFWQIDDDNHHKLTSGNLIFTLNMKAQATYKIVTPKLNSYAKAQSFVENPSVFITDGQTKIKASHIARSSTLKFKTVQNNKPQELPKFQQLKFWWLQASQYEKDLFTRWQKTNSHK